MKGLVLTGTAELTYQDVADPDQHPNDELVRIEYSGICGSDMHAFLGHDARRPAPLILGHEASGTIIGGPDDGERVTINPLVTCGKCDACKMGRNNICAYREIISMPPREGAFAEYVAIPRDNLVHLPDHTRTRDAALTEPLACGWHAVRLAVHALSRPTDQTKCLVIGGGAIGVGAALTLRAFGASDVSVSDTNKMRVEFLKNIDDFQVLDPSTGQAPEKDDFDLVIDGVGLEATRALACQCAKPGGVIAHIGLGDASGGLDVRRMTLQEIQFIGTYTYTAQDFRDTAQAIFDGRFGALDWVATRPLSDGQAAFDDIRDGRVQEPKIVLIP